MKQSRAMSLVESVAKAVLGHPTFTPSPRRYDFYVRLEPTDDCV